MDFLTDTAAVHSVYLTCTEPGVFQKDLYLLMRLTHSRAYRPGAAFINMDRL